MTRTSTLVSFGLFALALKQDSIPTCDDVQAFSIVDDLRTGNVTTKPYITMEPDFWLLDGNYKFKPSTTVHIGLMSLSMSDVSGSFAIPPELTIDFGSVHTTEGLTIKFAQQSNDFANSITVAFYDDTNTLIRSDAYVPTSWEFSTGQAVTDFKKIIITFNSTNKPYRYLRVTAVDYGELTYFTNADIKSASVVEEINPLSIELSVDTLELSLFSSDAAFSIIAPTGDYSVLQNKQPLDVYEVVDNEQVYIGQFYLDEWENPSDNEIIFRAIDKIGVLDTVPYLGGIYITPVNVEDLISTMMTAISAPYELDPDLEGTEINGWIPVGSYRQALQQIAFAIGAYVTCSRSGLVRIVKTVLASDVVDFDYTITKAEKSIRDQSLTLKTLVTGVEVTAHNYIENADAVELYNGALGTGEHTITFDAPAHDLSISGGTIVSSGANYAIVNVTVAGTVILSGEGYTDTRQVTGVYNGALDPNVPTNILSIDGGTLVNPSNVGEITQRVYDYYQQRYVQKVKLFAPTAAPGTSVLIDTLYNRQIGGVVEKMRINLTGGFTVQTEIVGVVTE